MADNSAPVEIPRRALFKAAEVCEIVKVQPYVLRSWEAEFPGLGVAKTAGGPRVYRRTDVEQVAQIKRLLLVEGLTLAGARRRLEGEPLPVTSEVPLDELIGQDARERITEVKRGLRAILALLSQRGETFRLAPPARVRTMAVAHVKPPRGKGAMSRNGAASRSTQGARSTPVSRNPPARASQTRRKRSA